MKAFVRFIEHKLPFFLLGVAFFATILDLILPKTGIVQGVIFSGLYEFLGYSVITNAYMLIKSWRRYCSATKLSIIGLIILNIFNFLVTNLNFYSVYYNLILESIIILIVLIYLIKGNDTIAS